MNLNLLVRSCESFIFESKEAQRRSISFQCVNDEYDIFDIGDSYSFKKENEFSHDNHSAVECELSISKNIENVNTENKIGMMIFSPYAEHFFDMEVEPAKLSIYLDVSPDIYDSLVASFNAGKLVSKISIEIDIDVLDKNSDIKFNPMIEGSHYIWNIKNNAYPNLNIKSFWIRYCDETLNSKVFNSQLKAIENSANKLNLRIEKPFQVKFNFGALVEIALAIFVAIALIIFIFK